MSSTMSSVPNGLHHGGATLFVVMSLETLAVGEEQRGALDDTRRELLASMEPSRLAERALLAHLADGVESRQLDRALVEADVRRVVAAARGVHDAAASALNRLHASLSPLQRALLADKVAAHLALWQRAAVHDSKTPAREQPPLSTWRVELHLSPAQLERIQVAIGERVAPLSPGDIERIDRGFCAFGDAFRSNVFDARILSATSDADEHMEGWAAAAIADLVEVVGPALTPEQRVQFADSLRRGPDHVSS